MSVLRDFSWKVQLHGRDIPLQCLEFDHASCGSVSGVRKLIDFLHTRSICSGSDDDKFLPLVTARKGKFMDTTGNFTHNFINLQIICMWQFRKKCRGLPGFNNYSYHQVFFSCGEVGSMCSM